MGEGAASQLVEAGAVAARVNADDTASTHSFTITDLAREFGVTSRTIRFYEGEGLIHPERRGSTRLYSRGDRARLAWILRGRAVGFSLADIRDLLDMYAPGQARRLQLEAALAKSRERVSALYAQRAAIDATIAELDQFCRTIEAKL
jgi:DNA-binding transcriptional MerR regulator